MASNNVSVRLYFGQSTREHVDSMLNAITATKIGAKVAQAFRDNLTSNSKSWFYVDLPANQEILKKLARELQARAVVQESESEIKREIVNNRVRPFERAASEIHDFMESDLDAYPENAIVLRCKIQAIKRTKASK